MNLRYYIYRVISWPFTNLPFWVIYKLSDFFTFLAWYIFRYRLKVIQKNIRFLFPEWSKEQVQTAIRKFYPYFTDVLLENLKLMSISQKKLAKMIQIPDDSLIQKHLNNGKSILLMTGHFGNWEAFMALAPLLRDVKCVGIYKTLSDKGADKLIQISRGKLGIELIDMKDAGQFFLSHRREKTITLLVADQWPAGNSAKKNVQFFGQEVPFFSGTERLAQTFGIIPIYGHCIREKRGKYKLEFSELDDQNITQSFAAHLEKDIKAHPHLWLWSHKRFKHLKGFYT